MRIALIGDGQSPHLLKWARALAAAADVELWVASSRGFAPGFDALVAPEQRLALNFNTATGGGNGALLASLPRLGAWLRHVDADWLHAHYLTSHGTLAWLAKRIWRLRARIVGSAWGSDILVTPQRSRSHRWLTQRVLRACTLTTSDSRVMTAHMRELGAAEIMTFAFGLEAMPTEPGPKEPWLFFANRGLEPLYRPARVLAEFAALAAAFPQARLVMANAGSLGADLPRQARALGLSVGAGELALDASGVSGVSDASGASGASGASEASADAASVAPSVHAQVEFVGRLDSAAQARCYDRAQWYLSLPESDSVAVSVLEAMAHGCIPLLSDLPANRELVDAGQNGLIVAETGLAAGDLPVLRARAGSIARANRAWIAQYGLFTPAVTRFLARLRELSISPSP